MDVLQLAIGNKIRVMGGNAGVATLNSVEVFDVSSQTWSRTAPVPNMPAGRAGFGALRRYLICRREEPASVLWRLVDASSSSVWWESNRPRRWWESNSKHTIVKCGHL
jgi:hypothetical protein